MNTATISSKRVVVIGGGITGLSAAHRLLELDPTLDVTLLEAGNQLGGVLRTVRQDGFLIEQSADNFITNIPHAVDLCRRLGIEDQLLPTNDAHRGAFVVCRGRLERIPEGFLIMAPSRLGPMMATNILSWQGKLRLAAEYFVRSRSDADESLASFAVRRFGREVYERLVQPLVGSIYTADPTKLSVRAAMARFYQMEQEHGSLIRGLSREAAAKDRANRAESGARYSLFTAPRDGMGSLVDALAERLSAANILLRTPVREIVRQPDGRWGVVIEDPNPERAATERIEADGVVVATPAHRAAKVLESVDEKLAGQLNGIEYSSCAVVVLAYRREQIGHALDGFGFVVPAVEKRRILSASFSSRKYAGRASDGCELMRVFVGGACQAELLETDDDSLKRIAVEELADLLAIRGEPMLAQVHRWGESMPQYHVGHLDRLERIAQRVALHSGLTLAGNAFQGVGVPQCVESGERAAAEVLEQLQTRPKPRAVDRE